MADPRHELASALAAAWERYASTVRLGGTAEQRRWACDQALAADEKLAAFDWAQQSQERREMAARALSGA